jgi:hypothetical protein
VKLPSFCVPQFMQIATVIVSEPGFAGLDGRVACLGCDLEVRPEDTLVPARMTSPLFFASAGCALWMSTIRGLPAKPWESYRNPGREGGIVARASACTPATLLAIPGT